MLWLQACTAADTTVKQTRPRRPQTNGEVERFRRILLHEWAYIRLADPGGSCWSPPPGAPIGVQILGRAGQVTSG